MSKPGEKFALPPMMTMALTDASLCARERFSNSEFRRIGWSALRGGKERVMTQTPCSTR